MKGRLCTGSKIGPRQILTAGHCVEDDQGKKLVPDGEDFGIFTYDVQSVPPDQTHSERLIRTEKIVTHLFRHLQLPRRPPQFCQAQWFW
jgi:hypothetical protein